MGKAAEGVITHCYHVLFVDARRTEDREQSATVLLTSGYTVFEDLRRIVSLSIGGTATDIDVVSVTRLPVRWEPDEVPAGEPVNAK